MVYTEIITFLQRLFYIRRSARSFESPRYLLKWLLISTLIGLVAGLGAIAFFASIHFATDILLGKIVGYLPPNPAGEGLQAVDEHLFLCYTSLRFDARVMHHWPG